MNFLRAGLLIITLGLSVMSHATIKLNQVVTGEVTIKYNEFSTIVLQDSNQATIEWDNLNLALYESLAFIVPDKNSISINKINSKKATIISGKIVSNGIVMLVNPKGVTIKEPDEKIYQVKDKYLPQINHYLETKDLSGLTKFVKEITKIKSNRVYQVKDIATAIKIPKKELKFHIATNFEHTKKL